MWTWCGHLSTWIIAFWLGRFLLAFTGHFASLMDVSFGFLSARHTVELKGRSWSSECSIGRSAEVGSGREARDVLAGVGVIWGRLVQSSQSNSNWAVWNTKCSRWQWQPPRVEVSIYLVYAYLHVFKHMTSKPTPFHSRLVRGWVSHHCKRANSYTWSQYFSIDLRLQRGSDSEYWKENEVEWNLDETFLATGP